MQLLGLNDYTDFAESIKNELKSGEEELPADNIKQIVNDINVYIFNKIKREEKIETEIVITPNINGEILSSSAMPTPSLRESIMKETAPADKYSIGFLTKPNLESDKPKEAAIVVKTEIVPEAMPDVYREMPEAVDKTIKHE
jgi:hypothetical protein